MGDARLVLKPAPDRPELAELLRKAAATSMTPAQEREQRISFVYGNIGMSNPSVTRQMVEDVVDGKRGDIPAKTNFAVAPAPRIGKWMSTFTGRQFWPLDPRADEVCIEDIAHALSMTCRYGGQCNRFYSVAEHSVLVARWLQVHYGELPAVVLKGLLHDAPEAYVTDVPRPIKGSLIGYKEIEARLWTVIANMHGISDAMPDEVHEADSRILADEMAQNMTLPDPDHNDPLGVTLQLWSPEEAEREYLAAYWSLIESGRL